MADQATEEQVLQLTSQDLALLLKQTILTFCQMNVAYSQKLEVKEDTITVLKYNYTLM